MCVGVYNIGSYVIQRKPDFWTPPSPTASDPKNAGLARPGAVDPLQPAKNRQFGPRSAGNPGQNALVRKTGSEGRFFGHFLRFFGLRAAGFPVKMP